jgi:hypothetical protein
MKPLPLSPSSMPRRAWMPILGSALWLAATFAGLGMFWLHENVPGQHLAVPAVWPAQSTIPHIPGHPALVMSAHPKCPCTQASMDQLAAVLAQCGPGVEVTVLFYKPRGAPDSWAHTSLWDTAAAIPGVAVRCDEEGREAALFGASTSGAVALYDAAGHLRFSGGITAERGHAGDNDGTDSLAAILNGHTPTRTTMPVLGCSLDNFQPGAVPALCTMGAIKK